MMQKKAKIYVAGHRGLVGSAIVRALNKRGFQNLILRTHQELDLTKEKATHDFFKSEKPDYIFLAAAKVGGIFANQTYPADFIRENLSIQNNVIHAAYLHKVKRLLFLGSSCIYPKNAHQPIKENYFLTGALETTNRAYALAKIAGVEMCWSYNRQFKTDFLAAMPTNLYGPHDNYDLNTSHVIPALIRKFHEAKIKNQSSVVVWGTGKPKREFMYSDDMANACVFLMNLPKAQFRGLLNPDLNHTMPPLINIGVGHDLTIRALACMIKKITGFKGSIRFDNTKPDGTYRKLMDVTRLDHLGFKAKIDLEKGLTLSYKSFMREDEALS
jgi:GDP-L-fucose synthase